MASNSIPKQAEISAAYDQIKDFLPRAAGEALKTSYSSVDLPDIDEALSAPTVTHYKIAGKFCGDFAIFFGEKERRKIADRFLELTPGLAKDSPGVLDAACLEVTNIILGHLAGFVSDQGTELGIAAPGVAISASDFVVDVPEFRSGQGCLIALAPVSPDVAGELTAWVKLDTSDAAAKPQKTVLIVDDSPAMTAFLEKVFRDNGYTIAGIATDGLEAFQKFEETNPDIVTLDIIMPKMRGTDVLKKILEKNPKAKVVMASSVSDARTVMQCLKIGAKRYIIKPYDEKAVLEAVEKTLGLN